MPAQITHERVAIDQCPDEDRLEYIALSVQRVMRIAYSRIFEKRRGDQNLEEGTIRKKLFDETDPERINNQYRRILDHISTHNSVYLLGWDDEDLVGLAKTSSLNPNRKIFTRGRFELNDIAVIYEGMGVGSTLLRAALSEYPGNGRLKLDAYEGNDHANKWFERLGFRAAQEQPEGLYKEIGGVAISQFVMEAPNIGSVVAKLDRVPKSRSAWFAV